MDPKHLTLLRIHDACRGMSVEEVDMIAVEAEVVEAAAGKVIHIAGDTIDAIHIVVSG